jgi:uncharacterized protein YwgA
MLYDFLKEKGISSSIYNMKKIQKAVYTAKCEGVNLGYSFGEYKNGMFSPELRDDVEKLNGVYQWDPA